MPAIARRLLPGALALRRVLRRAYEPRFRSRAERRSWRTYYRTARARPEVVSAGGVPAWVLRAGGIAANLDIDFVNNQAWNAGPVAISSLLTCSRASSGYYTKADGTLVSFGSNVLRYGTNGLLVEEARTNLILRSQEFENAAWTQTSLSSVTADQLNAPDGTLTADLVTVANAATVHVLSTTAGATVVSGSTYTASQYFKQGTGRYASLIISSTIGTEWFSATADLQLGTITQTGAGVGGTYVASSITALVGGWYRVSVTGSIAKTSLFSNICFNSTGAPTQGLYGQETWSPGATPTYYLWGAQYELGAFPTSYIPTTTTSATRAGDTVTFPTSSFAYGATTGTLYSQSIVFAGASGNLFQIDAGNTTERILLAQSNLFVASASAVQCQITRTQDANLDKLAGAYAVNDFEFTVNGVSIGTDNSGSLPTVTTARIFGNSNTFASGYTKRLAYWNSRISSADLQVLTT